MPRSAEAKDPGFSRKGAGGLTNLVPFLVSCAVAAAGYLARALTLGGAITATVVGTVILAATGWGGGAALAAFFGGSSLVSRALPDLTERFGAKGSRRDASQVLANGGAAAVGALAGLGFSDLGLWIVTASLASAAADTWATSIGALSPTPPRDLLTGRPVAAGKSGGVTMLGTLGAVAGAATVGLAASAASNRPILFAVSLASGLAGMLLDSALGAGLQGQFYCPRCNVPTENSIHQCRTKTKLLRGLPFLTNDRVNAIATSAAGLGGWFAWAQLG